MQGSVKGLQHPALLLSVEDADIIRSFSSDAEKLRLLHPAQLAVFYRQQWFKALVPAAYGGLELPLPEMVALEEAVSYADGSASWVMTLCSGAGWFAGFIDPVVAAIFFSGTNICICGSGAATGYAEKLVGGYSISGTWLHATGAPHATAFTANCIIKENGIILLNEKSEPVIRSFIFLKEEVTIIPKWNSIGMIATASFGFQVTDLHVSSDRCFIISPGSAVMPSPLYQYPFLQLAEVTLAANLSGMAMHFMDIANEYFSKKTGRNKILLSQEPVINKISQTVMETMSNARAAFYTILNKSWQQIIANSSINEEILQAVSTSSRALAAAARAATDSLYPYCGLSAADPSSELNRTWRDIHTASQHTMLLY
ncbi:MAG: acyl-CoA dehydrogenase [Taibaiella sp.]|nr:acyl-CoA dehydrogenase [Taibaiella sp.]